MTRLLLWLGLLALSPSILPSSQAPTLYQTDFTAGAAGWTAAVGGWAVAADSVLPGNAVYRNTNATGDAWATYGPQTWTDYAVTVRVRPRSFAGIGLVRVFARYQNLTNWYYVNLRSTGTVELRKYVNGVAADLATPKAFPVIIGTWYTVRLEVLGSNLKVFVNGVLQLSGTDTSFKAGPLALGSYNALGDFDDVFVESLASTPTQPGTVTDLTVASVRDSGVTLTFTTVTDGAGGAASYDVRAALAPLTWSTAASVKQGSCASPVAGGPVGYQQTCTVQGLAPGTMYEFALMAFRGTMNVNAVYGPLSNIVRATTTRTVPPPAGTGPVASVWVSPQGFGTDSGSPPQYVGAQARDSSQAPLGTPLTWTSSDTTVATVSPFTITISQVAIVIVRRPGLATMMATAGGKSGTIAVTVTSPLAPPPSVALSVRGYRVDNVPSRWQGVLPAALPLYTTPPGTPAYSLTFFGVPYDTTTVAGHARCTVTP